MSIKMRSKRTRRQIKDLIEKIRFWIIRILLTKFERDVITEGLSNVSHYSGMGETLKDYSWKAYSLMIKIIRKDYDAY